MTDMWQNIINHQINGVMFHYNAMLLFSLFEDFTKIKQLHYNQMLSELQNHCYTATYVIGKSGKLFEADKAKLNTDLLANIKERPMSRQERIEVCKNVLVEWKKWEEETVKMYEQAMEIDREARFLGRFKRSAQKEIQQIAKIQSQL